MTVRAKFKVNSVERFTTNRWDPDRREVEGGTVVLYPVTGNTDNAENAEFFANTPTGQITLTTVNTAALNAFEQGKEYYIDFTPAEKTE